MPPQIKHTQAPLYNSGYADQYQVYWINKRDVNNNPNMLTGAQSDVSPDAQSMICFSFSGCMDELPILLALKLYFQKTLLIFLCFQMSQMQL